MNTPNNPTVTNQITLKIEGKAYFLTQEEAEALYNQLGEVLNKNKPNQPVLPTYPTYPTYPSWWWGTTKYPTYPGCWFGVTTTTY